MDKQALTKNLLPLLIISIIFALIAYTFFVSSISYDQAPSTAKEGSTITMLVFNVSNTSSTGNTLYNVTITNLGTASAGNLTNITLQASDDNSVYYNDSFSSFPVIINVSKDITMETNFTLNVTINTSATDNVTIQINITSINAGVNVTTDMPLNPSGITRIDAASPSINFVSPTPNDYVNSSRNYVEVNITSYDTVTNISACLLEWNGTSNESMNIINSGNSVICYLNKTTLSDGTYTYRVYSNDSYNHWGASTTRTIRIDTVAPSVVVNNPQNGTWQNGTIVINITVTDTGSGVNSSQVAYKIDNGNWLSLGSGGGDYYNATSDTTSWGDGYHTISFMANDSVNLGQVNSNSSVSVHS